MNGNEFWRRVTSGALATGIAAETIASPVVPGGNHSAEKIHEHGREHIEDGPQVPAPNSVFQANLQATTTTPDPHHYGVPKSW